jgi:1-acyl-sn-glycerol-3-phosphate acyltransferase
MVAPSPDHGPQPDHNRGHSPRFFDEGFGYDLFGMHPPTAERVLRTTLPWYLSYFRVRSHDCEHIPIDGPAILIANHSGVLPCDGAMLWADVAMKTGRWLRPVSDRFIPLVPFTGSLFARVGVVSGTRANVSRLLGRGELIAIFPEGVTGPAKPFAKRYQLQDWRTGHAELAIRYQIPIIPVAIIGAELSFPLWRSLPVRVLGIPYLPIPMTPVPLPVRFDIHYGPPVDLSRRYGACDADDPRCVAAAANLTRTAVADLIERGRAARWIS